MTSTDRLDGRSVPGEPVTAAAADPPEQHVRAALDVRLRAMLAHQEGTVSGVDPEDLHQMRVSVRRMRAVLRAARPLLDRAWADELRGELGWLGRALGPVRDLDVLLERLEGEAAQLGAADEAAAAPLLEALRWERELVRGTMIQAMAGQRYERLLARLAASVRGPLPPRAEDGDDGDEAAEEPAAGERPVAKEELTEDSARQRLPELVAREYRRLRKAVQAAGKYPPDQVLHELRIKGKRLRYTTELAEPALGGDARALLKAAEALQDTLGEHQDACVAQQRVRTLLAGLGATAGSGTAFAAGRLFEREEARRVATGESWRDRWKAVRQAASAAGVS